MTDLALIAGRGRLPVLIAEAAGAVLCVPRGTVCDVPGEAIELRLERLASFMETLRARGVRRIGLAGGVDRPVVDPEAVEPETAPYLERIAVALRHGDDGALRVLLSILEEAGFEIVAAHDLRPDLMPGAGVLAGTVSETDAADAARAAAILAATGPLDIGQGCVVAQGLCLAVEAHPGTDHMLRSLRGDLGGRRPDPTAGRGVLMKAPKPGQDMRADVPAIGPDTIDTVADAGLAGIAVPEGGVLMLDSDEMRRRAERRGVFLWCRA